MTITRRTAILATSLAGLLLAAPAVQDIFESHGVTLEITNVQGPQVVTGVVSGQFDLAYAA